MIDTSIGVSAELSESPFCPECGARVESVHLEGARGTYRSNEKRGAPTDLFVYGAHVPCGHRFEAPVDPRFTGDGK